MYEDDFLLRQIRRAVEAIARRALGEKVERAEVDDAVRDAVGLDLDTLDRLPLPALLALHVPTDDRSAERLRALGQLLLAMAEAGEAGERQRARGEALLDLVGR